MKTNQIFAAIGFITALGAANSASALTFGFSPTGNGVYTVTADLIDQTPGSALAVGGVTAINNFQAGTGPTAFTLLYQANLFGMSLDGSPVYADGLSGPSFNFTMALTEQVTSVTTASDGSVTANFDILGGSLSMFQGHGNNLTGVGFGVGSPIMTATVDPTLAQSSVYTAQQSQDPEALDQSPNGDQWGGAETVVGSGATLIGFDPVTSNPSFFSGLGAFVLNLSSSFNTSTVTPFKQVDPSQAFIWAGVIPNIGTVNGAPTPTGGPDFLFQADGNQSFAGSVPEPSTLSLLGLAMLGFSLVRQRKFMV